MFGKNKEERPKIKKTLYRAHLRFGDGDTLDVTIDAEPNVADEKSSTLTCNRYAHGPEASYVFKCRITFEVFDVMYYETFEADIIEGETYQDWWPF